MGLRPYVRMSRLSLLNPVVGINISASRDGIIAIHELLLVQVTSALLVDETPIPKHRKERRHDPARH